MERMISRTTSLDPSKLMNINRRVNFELESVDENVNDTSRYTKQQSFDLPSSAEYFKQKQRQKRQQKKQQQQQPRLQRQSKLKTHSEIIDEVEEDNETSSSTPPRDEQQVTSTIEEHGTPAKIEKGGRKNSSSKKQKGRKTHSEIVDDVEEEQNATTSTTNQNEEEEEEEEVEENIAAYYEENNEDSDDEYEDDYDNVGSPVDPDLEVLNRAPANINFEYKSFIRLRNIIYLALLLRKNPSLRKYRFHYLQEMKRREAAMKSRVQSSSELFNEKFEKLKQKLNWRNFNLFKSSSTGTSSTDTSQPPNGDDDFPSTPTDNGNNEPLVRPSRVRTSSL